MCRFLIKFQQAGNVGDKVCFSSENEEAGAETPIASCQTLLECGLVGKLLFCKTVSEAHLEFCASDVNQFWTLSLSLQPSGSKLHFFCIINKYKNTTTTTKRIAAFGSSLILVCWTSTTLTLTFTGETKLLQRVLIL